MKLFWVVNGQKLKKYIILMVAAFFTAGIIYADRDSISVFSSATSPSPGGPEAIYSVDMEEKKLALTFDISWGNERPGPILDVLEQKGVKEATFFLSAPWAENHPEIVTRIKELGFEIGSHGHKHIDYSHLKDDEIREQILKSHQILQQFTGTTPHLLRPPNGDFDRRVLQIANELGYQLIQWDTDSQDWLNPGVEKIVENVVSKAHPGDIVLLHASDSCKQTHEALPHIIDQLREKGYEFASVSSLITGAEAQVKELN